MLTKPFNMEEAKRREILFRKFQVAKRSNHWKYVPKRRIHTLREYVPQAKLLKAMLKIEKKHQKITDTQPNAVLKLARFEKKYASLAWRLRKAALTNLGVKDVRRI